MGDEVDHRARFLGLEDIRKMSVTLATDLALFFADAQSGLALLPPATVTPLMRERLGDLARMKSIAWAIRDAVTAYEKEGVAIAAARVVQAAAKEA